MTLTEYLGWLAQQRILLESLAGPVNLADVTNGTTAEVVEQITRYAAEQSPIVLKTGLAVSGLVERIQQTPWPDLRMHDPVSHARVTAARYGFKLLGQVAVTTLAQGQVYGACAFHEGALMAVALGVYWAKMMLAQAEAELVRLAAPGETGPESHEDAQEGGSTPLCG